MSGKTCKKSYFSEAEDQEDKEKQDGVNPESDEVTEEDVADAAEEDNPLTGKSSFTVSVNTC